MALTLLDPRARRAAHVELDEARVDAREKIATDERQQQRRRSRYEYEENAGDGDAMTEREREKPAVPRPKAIEATVERREDSLEDPARCAMRLGLAAQEEVYERWYQRSRQEVGHEHREHDGHGERHEERFG